MDLPREYHRLVALVYGQTGNGKTILARAILRRRVQKLGFTASGIVVDTVVEHVDLPAIALDSLHNWLQPTDRCSKKTPYEARVLIPEDEDFSLLADELEGSAGGRGPVVLMVDEVSRWSSPGRSTPGLSRLIRYGRHWQVDLVGVARRAAETSRELSSQLTELYIIGSVVEPRDRTYLSGILPLEAVTKLDTLAGYRYLRYSTLGTYKVFPPVQIS